MLQVFKDIVMKKSHSFNDLIIIASVADGVDSWTLSDLADLVLGDASPKNLYLAYCMLSSDKLYFKVSAIRQPLSQCLHRGALHSVISSLSLK
eukprot:scaffold137026_cov18-Tisochrysis_lutea.AAC.1